MAKRRFSAVFAAGGYTIDEHAFLGRLETSTQPGVATPSESCDTHTPDPFLSDSPDPFLANAPDAFMASSPKSGLASSTNTKNPDEQHLP